MSTSTLPARQTDLYLLHPAIGLLGRLCFTLIFFISGITHFTRMSFYVEIMPESIPFREFWVILAGVVELAGAIMILLNRAPRLGGWLIVLFLVPVTIVVHGAGIVNAPDQRMADIQTSFFLKGITMLGGALLITQLGVRGAKRPGDTPA